MGGAGAASRQSAAAVGRGSATPGESRQARERKLKERTAGEDGPFRGRPAGGAACERGCPLTGEGSDNDHNDITAGRPTARPAGSDSRERTEPATTTWRHGHPGRLCPFATRRCAAPAREALCGQSALSTRHRTGLQGERGRAPAGHKPDRHHREGGAAFASTDPKAVALLPPEKGLSNCRRW